MLERTILLSTFWLACLTISGLIFFVIFYNKKIANLANTYEKSLSRVRQEIQQKTLNNLSFDIIETFGNNLFAIRCNLFGGVLDPLQKVIDDINQGLGSHTKEEPTDILKNILASVINIQNNVLDAKKPIDDMNDDTLKACHRLKTLFADKSLIENLETDLNHITSFEIFKNFTGKPYPLDNDKDFLVLWIFQLALANIIKHSKAKQIHIDIRYEPDSFCLRIRDDGIGFHTGQINNLRKKGSGLDLMYSSARMINATISIDARPQMGVTITILLQTLPT